MTSKKVTFSNCSFSNGRFWTSPGTKFGGWFAGFGSKSRFMSPLAVCDCRFPQPTSNFVIFVTVKGKAFKVSESLID